MAYLDWLTLSQPTQLRTTISRNTNNLRREEVVIECALIREARIKNTVTPWFCHEAAESYTKAWTSASKRIFRNQIYISVQKWHSQWMPKPDWQAQSRVWNNYALWLTQFSRWVRSKDVPGLNILRKLLLQARRNSPSIYIFPWKISAMCN